jgi:acyl-CoA synthetase (AMP-forming)/AMP-acid ligase II
MAVGSAARWGAAPAIIDGDQVLSFTAVRDEMLQIAAALVSRGVTPGARVAVWAPNCARFVTVAPGIQAAGAWLVPINTRLRGEEAAYILNRVEADALFTVEGFLQTDYAAMLRSADPHVTALRNLIYLPGPKEPPTPQWNHFVDEGSARDGAVVQERIDSLGPDDICDVMFTSGTTGQPKGVMLRHGASLQGFARYNEGYGLAEGSRHLVITPFFHCFGYKAGWMISLHNGAVTYPLATFNPLEAMRLIQQERITHMPGSPTMFQAILDHPQRREFDLSTLDTSLISSASVPPSVVHRVRSELGVTNTPAGYGLTENHALGSVSRPGDSAELVCTTSGQIMSDIEARIVDDSGFDVPIGEEGELLLRGPYVMSGYYDDPVATAAVVKDSWLHTGDVAKLTADNYLTVTDRKKDIYITGGFNVAPAEIERVLAEMPGVAQVAVVGAPDDHFGEVGVAFVVPSPGVEITSGRVTDYARQRLANYKVPRRIEVVDGLPQNATGKVLKHVLRDRVR